MKRTIKKIITNPYFIISVVYVLAHIFLLFLSGCWWDDWSFMSHNIEYINEVASKSGRPEWNILIPLCWSLTNNGRILIFFLYYLDSIFVYNILINSTLFKRSDALFVTLIFASIPVNEARILISNFPYSVGLFLFYLAFMLFIRWNNKKQGKNILRVSILVLFLFSFILNSLLAYYYIIFVYLFVLDCKENGIDKRIKNIIVKIKNIIIKYIDFFLLPFLYLFLNKALFPVTDEIYEGRSSITLKGILKCFKYLPLSIINVFKEVYCNMFACLKNWIIVIVCVIISLLIFIEFRKEDKERENKKIFVNLVLGIIILSLALFAYVEIRGNIIVTTGVKGRDSILIPLGFSIIIVSIYTFFRNRYKLILLMATTFLCIISFNSLYVEWQKDYYYQLSIENLLDNEIVKNNDTFFLANLNEPAVQGERYYSLNMNAYHVYKEETRFFIPKVSNLYMLESKEEIEIAKTKLNGSKKMKDYNPDDYYIDAVLIYRNDLGFKDVLKLKYYELFNKEEFNKLIKSSGTMEIIEVDDDFTTKLLEKYDNNEIKDDFDVVEMLEVYYN